MPNPLKTLLLRGAVAAIALSPLAAFAIDPTPVPEPGSWSLVGLALVAAIALSRNKRK